MIKEVTPLQAWEILNTNPDAVLLDVRSTMEYEYVGHPLNAVLVPWKEPPGWEINTDFVVQAQRALRQQKDDAKAEKKRTVLCLCRSGARSRAAAEALFDSGFEKVLNIAQGFEGDRDKNGQRGNINGWRFHGLPWEQG